MMFLNAQKPGLIKDPYIYKADSLMLDLEDAVAENQKDVARFSLYHALKTVDYRGAERVVRINGLDTPYWRCLLYTSRAAMGDDKRAHGMDLLKRQKLKNAMLLPMRHVFTNFVNDGVSVSKAGENLSLIHI